MSLVDPDARRRQISSALRPIAWVLAILAALFAPVAFAIVVTRPDRENFTVIFFLLTVLFMVGSGLMLYYTVPHRNPLGIAAYIVAYVAGLALINGLGQDSVSAVYWCILIAVIIYVVAIVLLVVYFVHTRAANETIQDGVETTATVTSAGINGMVNYVQHWRLTLKFTDQSGHDRWFHIGRTGLGYQVGQQFQIKYSPKHPARGIVVLDG